MADFYFIKQHLSSESGFTAAQQQDLRAVFHEFSELVEDLQEQAQTLQDRVTELEEV